MSTRLICEVRPANDLDEEIYFACEIGLDPELMDRIQALAATASECDIQRLYAQLPETGSPSFFYPQTMWAPGDEQIHVALHWRIRDEQRKNPDIAQVSFCVGGVGEPGDALERQFAATTWPLRLDQIKRAAQQDMLAIWAPTQGFEVVRAFDDRHKTSEYLNQPIFEL